MNLTAARNYTEHHTMLRALRGKASEHPCHDCGGPARDWSYDRRDPAEVIEWQAGEVAWRVWSRDVDRYVPRCRPCHWRHDNPTGAVRRRTPATTAYELDALLTPGPTADGGAA